MEEVQLEELLDLYHLAIEMQSYEQLDTHCQGKRCQLLQAVSALAVQLRPEYIEYVGISLCDRLIIGVGKERMQRVIDMHGALVLLIADSDINRQIAMTILLATFAKISGLELPRLHGDIVIPPSIYLYINIYNYSNANYYRFQITLAFDLVKRVDWMRLIVDGCEADMFALLRSFALIINTYENRVAHPHWHAGIGSEIHKFFMQVLRTVRFSSKYNNLIMMVGLGKPYRLIGYRPIRIFMLLVAY